MKSTAIAWVICLLLGCGLLVGNANAQSVGDELEKAKALNKQVIELYRQGKYSEAIPLAKEVLAVQEKVLGPDHPDVAYGLNNLGSLYDGMGAYDQAEPLYNKALAIREKNLGPEHPNVATSLNNLATLYYNTGEYAQAEPLYKRAVSILERSLGSEHPNTVRIRKNLEANHAAMNKAQ